MKVLTIKEPYASLIANGYKKYEFRTWKTNYRGELLIHAGNNFDKKSTDVSKYKLKYRKKEIIAKVIITDCIKVDDEFRKQLKKENELVYSNIIHNNNWQGYAFKLENVKKVKPIKISGQLGLWTIEDEYIDRPILWSYLKLLDYLKMPYFLKKYLKVPSLLRLKKVGYFCGMDYASNDIYDFKEYVSRYDHSIAVALITWKLTKDKVATIAALFHDISTPAFSHAIDYMNKDYANQDSTEKYTEKIIKSDIKLLELLKEDDVNPNDIINFKKHTIVDNNRPKLCADRLDGIILPSLFWTKRFEINDVKKIIKDLVIYSNENGEKEIGLQSINIAKKMVDANQKIDESCHSKSDMFMMSLLAKIAKTAIEKGYFSYDDLFTLDEKTIMDIIGNKKDKEIQLLLEQFKNIKKDAIPNIEIPNIKKRIINPLVDNIRYNQIN